MSEEEGFISSIELLALGVDLYFEVFVLLVAGDRHNNIFSLCLCDFGVDNHEVGFHSHALLEYLTVELDTGVRAQVSDSVFRDDRDITIRIDQDVYRLFLGIEISPVNATAN